MTLPFSWAPVGWASCTGQLLNVQQYQALFSLLGVTYGGDAISTFGVPNLCGRTVLGSGTDATGKSWIFGATGGTPEATLTVANMPSHTHSATFIPSATTSTDVDVNATVTGSLNAAVSLSAAYNAVGATATTGTPGANLSLGIAQPGLVKIYASNPGGTAVSIGTVTANGNVTGALSVAATGSYPSASGATVTVGNSGGGAPFNIMPPYLSMNVVIAIEGLYPSRP